MIWKVLFGFLASVPCIKIMEKQKNAEEKKEEA